MTPERRVERNAYERQRRAADQKRREKNAAYQRAWRAANPEKVAAIEKKCRAGTIRAKRLRDRAYYRSNSEKVKARSEAWRLANPDRIAEWRANRRARKVAAGGRLSPGLVERLYHLQKGKCACCGRPLGRDFNLDHIMPLALGGSNTDENIQLLLPGCNNLKRAKHPLEFMQQERGMLL